MENEIRTLRMLWILLYFPFFTSCVSLFLFLFSSLIFDPRESMPQSAIGIIILSFIMVYHLYSKAIKKAEEEAREKEEIAREKEEIAREKVRKEDEKKRLKMEREKEKKDKLAREKENLNSIKLEMDSLESQIKLFKSSKISELKPKYNKLIQKVKTEQYLVEDLKTRHPVIGDFIDSRGTDDLSGEVFISLGKIFNKSN